MTQASNTSARLRSILLAGTACAAFVAGFETAKAQDGDAKVEKVVVTGSRISRKNLESTNTTSIVTTDQIYRNGSANVADLLNTLPQFAPTLSRTSTTFSGAATAGLNNANLRNVGSVETLTLINGRRVPAGRVEQNQVDFNTIPTANIERIEILTGGASAIYGADAVAGVVNIITKKNFEGYDFGASYGVAELGDNINPRGYAMFGSGLGEKGFFTVTAQYEYQGLVSCANRTLCETDFFWAPPNPPLRGPGVSPATSALSAVAPQGTFFIGAGNALPAVNYTLRTGNWVTPFTLNLDGYDRNPKRTIAQPTERLMFAGEAEYEVVPRITAFVEANYGSSETDSQFEGNPFTSNPTNGIGGPVPAGGIEVTIPRNNPFMPAVIGAAMDARGDAELTWSQRLDFFGFRGSENLRQTARVVGGLKGEFDSLFGIGSDWGWEASYVYGRTTLDSRSDGAIDLIHLYSGLRVEASGVADNPATPDREDFRCVDPVQRALGCVPINPFGGEVTGSYTQRMQDYISTEVSQQGLHEMEDAVAFLSGSVFELPAGPVQMVVGAEWRRTLGSIDYGANTNTGTAIGNIIGDTESQNKWQEAFGEVLVPILTDVTLAKELRVEGSYRRTHADGQGSYDTWKYGGVWEPIGGIKLRAVQSRAIRAPVTSEQSGFGQTFGTVNDPCNTTQVNANPTRAANCLADGFNAGPYTPPVAVLQNVGGFNFGNPDVKPEVADTLTYGFVITPELIPGFSLTVDRFDIAIDKQIALIGRTLIANLCYDLPVGQRDVYCSQIRRGFNPNVTQVQYQNLALVEVFDTFQNNTLSEVKGVDIEVNYRTELADWFGESGDIGSLHVGAIISLFDHATALTTVPGAAPQFTDFLGFAGQGGQLERQGKINVNYMIDGLRLNWEARYVDESINSPFVAAAARTTIPDHWYHNFHSSYDVSENYQFYFGVTNVMDQEPPFFPSGTTGIQALDTVPQYYDVFGRSYYAGFRVQLQ